MKKNLILILGLVIIYNLCSGQDKITRTNSKVIDCKIKSVDDEVIYFTIRKDYYPLDTRLSLSEVSFYIWKDKNYFLADIDSLKAIEQGNYFYRSDVTFSIDSYDEAKSIARGSAPGMYTPPIKPEKGNKFVFVYITVSNSGSNNIQFDFTKFSLADTEKNSFYKFQFSMNAGGVNIMHGDKSLKIKAVKSESFKMVFDVPKEFDPKQIIWDKQSLDIVYSPATRVKIKK